MKAIYIVSSPHGGSTLLSLVLGKHPLAATLGEVSFIPKLLSLNELCTCGEVFSMCPTWSKVFDSLASNTGSDLRASPYSLYLGDAVKHKSGSGLIDHAHQTRWRYISAKLRGAIDTAALFAAPVSLGYEWSTLPSIKASVGNTIKLYESAANAWGKELIIDASKLPRKAPHLYLRDPDRIRILHLVRDGRGVVASRKKYMPLSIAAERWNHYHRLTLRILRRWVPHAHRRMVRYEDFTADPPAILRSLCDWLEIPYSSEMLEFHEGMAFHSAGGNPARFNLSGGINQADDRWRHTLSTKDLEIFDRIAGKLNRELGYE